MSEQQQIRPARDSLSARHDIEVSIDAVRKALDALRYGSITLTVHDAHVVQLDVTERTRFAG
ncbi:YezD family protein [Sphingobium aquiterrae]|uniref:YezD family protein n=1 Tax=Sphingobium aquiterrae TaxID=2038656 RepID=UPI003015F605